MTLKFKNCVPTEFTLDLSTIDKKISKVIKFIENGIIAHDIEQKAFSDFYDYKALKYDLKDRKYKENFSKGITDSYSFAINPKRREIFELPPDEWKDVDLLKTALSFFTGPRDADGNIFGSFEAINTNPNNLLLQLFNIKPYKTLKVTLLSAQELETYYSLSGNKIKADKYATILKACVRTASDDLKNGENFFDHKFNIFSKFMKREYFLDGEEEETIFNKIFDLAEKIKNVNNSDLFSVIAENNEILEVSRKADLEFYKILEDRSFGGFSLLNAPDFSSNNYEIFKIKVLQTFIEDILNNQIKNTKAAATVLTSFKPKYGYYDFGLTRFLDFSGSPVSTEIGLKEELYLKLSYFKENPDVLNENYQKDLSRTSIELVKPLSKFTETITRMIDTEFSAIISASESKVSPTVLAILSDIEFIAECIEEPPMLLCPPSDLTIQELKKANETSLSDVIDSYMTKEPNGMHKMSIKKDEEKIPFFDYNNFPEYYFIPFNGYIKVDRELTEAMRSEIVKTKFYYTSPDQVPSFEIMSDKVFNRLFSNIIMQNGFAGFFPPTDSFLKDKEAISKIIDKILKDAESAAAQGLETIQKTILARTNIVCLIEEVITCLFPQGINCKEFLRALRLNDIQKILETFFPKTIYKDLYIAINKLLEDQMSEEQRKLKIEIDKLEKDILNNPRSAIIYNLLNSGSKVELVRDLADQEEKKLASNLSTDEDRISILQEKKRLYASLYNQVTEENTQTSQSVSAVENNLKKIDQFLDEVEKYVDIEILCDLARLAELLDISFSFNFNWPMFTLPSFYLDFSFKIEDVTLELLIQTIIELIIGLLNELLTCNGISNLVAAAISGDPSGEGVLENIAAAANQLARGKFDLEEFTKNSGSIKNLNICLDNLSKNINNSIKAQTASSISFNQADLPVSVSIEQKNSLDVTFNKPSTLKTVTSSKIIAPTITDRFKNVEKFEGKRAVLPHTNKNFKAKTSNLKLGDNKIAIQKTNTIQTKKNNFQFKSTKNVLSLQESAKILKNTLDIKRKLKDYNELDPDKKAKSSFQANKKLSVLTEKQIKEKLVNLINEIALILEPDELVNLLGGTPSEETLDLISAFIEQNIPDLKIISNKSTLRNLFSYMSSLTGLDKLKDNIIKASFVKNKKQQHIRNTFCIPQGLSDYDISKQIVADKMTGGDAEKSALKMKEDRKKARDKFASIASNILKSDPSKMKKTMDELVFKPIIMGKMPDGSKISNLDESKRRNINYAIRDINKDFKIAANSLYSRLNYRTTENVTINEFVNKQGDSIEDSDETVKKEERKADPEFKYYESMGVGTKGNSDEEYGKSLEVTKIKIINCGAFSQNFDSIADRTKVKIITEQNSEEQNSEINYGSIQINMNGSIAKHQDLPESDFITFANGFTDRQTWKISYKESNIGRAFINVSSSNGLELDYKNTLSSEDVNISSFSKYVDLTLSKMNEGIVSTNYNKNKVVNSLKTSYEQFIRQILSGLSRKITEDSLLKEVKEPSSEIISSLIGENDLPEAIKNALQNPNPLKTQIIVDTPLKYINFAPNPTKKQKDKNKDPGLYGGEEIVQKILNSFEKRTEEFLEKYNMLSSEELYQMKLQENIDELAMFDGFFISLIRVICSEISLKSLFVNRMFNFDKKVLENLLLASYCSRQAIDLIQKFSLEINLKSLREGMSQQIDSLYLTYFPKDEEDKFSKDIKALKKRYKKIESDRNVLLRYKNDKINPKVISTKEMKSEIDKEINCAEDEMEMIRNELNFLQLRNICKLELETIFDKLSHITKTDCADSDRTAEQILFDLVSSSDALMSNISSQINSKLQEYEDKKELVTIKYYAQKLANEELDRRKQERGEELLQAAANQQFSKVSELNDKLSEEYLNSELRDLKREYEENGEAEAEANKEIERRKNELLLIETKGIVDVVTLHDSSKLLSENDFNEAIEIAGGEELYLSSIKRPSTRSHVFEKYIRVPLIKESSNQFLNLAKQYQEKYSLYGIINFQNFIGLIKHIRSYQVLKNKKIFEIFDGELKIGVRLVNILDDDNTHETILEEDQKNAKGVITKIKEFATYNKFKIYFGPTSTDDINVKKDKFLLDKTHAIPYYKNGTLKIINPIPLMNKEVILIDINNSINSLSYVESTDGLLEFIQKNSQNIKKLKEELSCDELNDILTILSNQGVAVGLLSVASNEMLSDQIINDMFNSVKFKIIQKYMTSWIIANGGNIFSLLEFFNQEWFIELITSFLNVEIILKACIYVLQFYCRLTDPNIPIALAIRDTIKSGVSIGAGPFSGKLKPPDDMPLPVAPFSLALLPMTVFPPPPAGPGIGPPLTIPGMIYLGADIILILFDLLKNLDFGSDDKNLKNLLKPYCVDLSRYKKYGTNSD